MKQQIHPRALTLDHITSIYTSTSVNPTGSCCPIMPPTSLVDPDKAKAAVRILIRVPGSQFVKR
jgi:hypothetical protein